MTPNKHRTFRRVLIVVCVAVAITSAALGWWLTALTACGALVVFATIRYPGEKWYW